MEYLWEYARGCVFKIWCARAERERKVAQGDSVEDSLLISMEDVPVAGHELRFTSAEIFVRDRGLSSTYM